MELKGLGCWGVWGLGFRLMDECDVLRGIWPGELSSSLWQKAYGLEFRGLGFRIQGRVSAQDNSKVHDERSQRSDRNEGLGLWV